MTLLLLTIYLGSGMELSGKLLMLQLAILDRQVQDIQDQQVQLLVTGVQLDTLDLWDPLGILAAQVILAVWAILAAQAISEVLVISAAQVISAVQAILAAQVILAVWAMLDQLVLGILDQQVLQLDIVARLGIVDHRDIGDPLDMLDQQVLQLDIVARLGIVDHRDIGDPLDMLDQQVLQLDILDQLEPDMLDRKVQQVDILDLLVAAVDLDIILIQLRPQQLLLDNKHILLLVLLVGQHLLL